MVLNAGFIHVQLAFAYFLKDLTLLFLILLFKIEFRSMTIIIRKARNGMQKE